MAITVRIPTPLRRVTDGQDKVDTNGATLREIIDSMESQFPGIKERLCDENGDLRNFVNVYRQRRGRALPGGGRLGHRRRRRDKHRSSGGRRLTFRQPSQRPTSGSRPPPG